MSTRPASRTAQTARPRAASRPRRVATRRSSGKKRIKTFFAVGFLLLETVLAIALVSVLVVFWKFSHEELPHLDLVVNDSQAPIATTIVSQDGVVLGTLPVENRVPISLKEAPKVLLDATIAIEDHRFYEHPGVDVQGIARAAWTNFRSKALSEGGSTLTQQLLRNLNQTGISKEKRIERKVREALTALRMEQIYSKDEILRLYLNHAYYGGGATGVQAASRLYFSKSIGKLKLSEAALLAGLPQRPSVFNPYRNLDAVLARRDEVLNSMRDYGYITAAQCEAAKAEKPKIYPRRRRKRVDYKAPYFVTYVLKQLNDRYGEDFVASGLKIETTLNWQMQKAAEETLRKGIENSPANQGALVTLDPRTGYIRAMVGGRSFYADEYNVVTQGIGRQPGSTFKVFDYAAAFDTDTANLYSSFLDSPYPYPGDPLHRVVQNYGGRSSGGHMTCKTAITHSTNTVAVRVAEKTGIKTIIAYARKMGITTKLQPYLSTALGASEVRPLDLCSAYSVFATGGDRCQPMAIVRVTDAEGNVLHEEYPKVEQHILKSDTIRQMDEALEAVVTRGTGTRARGSEANGIIENVRGKTGTTNDNKDAWFAGYTPELATVIWVANIGRRKRSNPMPGTTGGQVCAPIWHDFMVRAVPIQRQFKTKLPIGIVDSLPDTKLVEEKPKPKPKKPTEEETPEETPQEPANPDDTNTTETEPNQIPEPGNGENGALPPTTADTAPTPRERPLPPPVSAPVTTPPNIGNMRIGNSAPRENAVNTSPPGTLRSSPPVMRSTPPPVRSAPPPEMRTVSICVDSGQVAHDYCPAHKTVSLPASQARKLRRCRTHRPPPGEGD